MLPLPLCTAPPVRNCACAPCPCMQLLGMKGASAETNIWKIRLQLMKPVTWIPLIWGARLPSLQPGSVFRCVGHPGWPGVVGCCMSGKLRQPGNKRQPPPSPAWGRSLARCLGLTPRTDTPPPRFLAAGVLCGAAASAAFSWTCDFPLSAPHAASFCCRCSVWCCCLWRLHLDA